MRGAEGVLRFYYEKIVTRNRVKIQVWGEIIKDLKNKKTNKSPKELLDNLDAMRTNFRNPTQHPERRYDIEEVQDLYNLCIDVVKRMIKDLQNK